jgi:dihydrofolate reductase
MELIVAVYDDWGIGCEGTQPIALSADRKFFREMTRGATVIAGRKTVGDFPGGKPLPGRMNIVLTRGNPELPGFTICHSPEEAMLLTKDHPKVMVIGGGTVYRQMLGYCDKAIITKVHCTTVCDTYFPNLDEDPTWFLRDTVMAGEENGIRYEMCVYERR